MSKFKVGDRVIINQKERLKEVYTYTQTGSEGVIKKIDNDNYNDVQFYKLVSKLTAGGRTSTYNINERYLSHCFKVDDKVTILSKSIQVCGKEIRDKKWVEGHYKNNHGFITKIYGNPYGKIQNKNNCFVIGKTKKDWCGNYFAPQDLLPSSYSINDNKDVIDIFDDYIRDVEEKDVVEKYKKPKVYKELDELPF